jgi:bifunctional non-homologous end joining protein LigD
MVARRDGEHLRLLSRRGLDWADRFPAIVTAIEALAIRSCTIDDEAIACDSNGPADFQLLRRGRAKDESLLVAFDLLNSTAAIFGVSRSRRGKRSWRGS